jgi:hypothetical protein
MRSLWTARRAEWSADFEADKHFSDYGDGFFLASRHRLNASDT